MPNKRVLISRESDEKLRWLAAQNGWELTGVQTLKITSLPLEWNHDTAENELWLITSKNALEAFAEAYKNYGIACRFVASTAPGTANRLRKMGIEPDITAPSAREMTPKLEGLEIGQVRFFCGNHRKDELPGYFAERNIPVREMMVYKSEAVFPKMETTDFDAVIFTSPLSAKSLLEKNALLRDVPVAVMGPSTLEAAQNFGFKNIFLPESPSYKALFSGFNKHLS